MDEREMNKQVKRDDREELPPHGDPLRTGGRNSNHPENRPDAGTETERGSSDPHRQSS